MLRRPPAAGDRYLMRKVRAREISEPTMSAVVVPALGWAAGRLSMCPFVGSFAAL